MSVDQALMVLAGVAVIWLAMRFLYRPKGARASLGAFFKREPVETVPGLGVAAIRSLVDDLQDFARQQDGLRGLILAGPFAIHRADSRSILTAIFIAQDLTGQDDPAYLASWAYPARGHPVQSHQIERFAGVILHRIRLRGAPPLELAFVLAGQAKPEILSAALDIGALPTALGTDDAQAHLDRWGIRATRTGRKAAS
jgi:hypothetical protein